MTTAGRHSQSQAKFADSQQHGAGCELFLVEGDSAARSVIAMRDAATQAVLPLQGKPMNAWKADARKVAANVLFRQLAQAMGWEDPTQPVAHDALASQRFERVILLFDPDADGIHIEALMLLYFARWQPQLIGNGNLWRVRAPMFVLTDTRGHRVEYAYSQAHAHALRAQWQQQGISDVPLHAYRGLGSIPPEVLHGLCIDPATRRSRVVGHEDVDAVLQVFGGMPSITSRAG